MLLKQCLGPLVLMQKARFSLNFLETEGVETKVTAIKEKLLQLSKKLLQLRKSGCN